MNTMSKTFVNNVRRGFKAAVQIIRNGINLVSANQILSAVQE